MKPDELRKSGYEMVDAIVDRIERQKLAQQAQIAEIADRERVRIAKDMFEELYEDAMQEKVH